MIPSSGQNGLSRLDSFTTWPPDAAAVSSGVSRRTSCAGLSSRRPLNDGARRCPSCVHSANSTSQTSSGSTQTTSACRTFGIFGTTASGDAVAAERLELREQRVDVAVGEAGAAVADPVQLAAAVRAEHERAEAAGAARPGPSSSRR